MIETDKLIYIQMQKTGCTRIGEIITQLCGGQSVGRKHGTLLKKPGKFVIGSIRNPWAWYVSLWAFGCEGRGGVFSWLKDDPEWQWVYSDVNNPLLFRQWLAMIYSDKYLNQMQNGYNQFSLAPHVGLMTWRYAYLYLAGIDIDLVPHFVDYDQFIEYEQQYNIVDRFIKLEALESTLFAALIRAGHDIEFFKLILLCQEKINVSKHLPYQEYYDRASRELIREHERLIVDRFGYNFDE